MRFLLGKFNRVSGVEFGANHSQQCFQNFRREKLLWTIRKFGLLRLQDCHLTDQCVDGLENFELIGLLDSRLGAGGVG